MAKKKRGDSETSKNDMRKIGGKTVLEKHINKDKKKKGKKTR